jgi:L-ribulose-5-phosphate 4-epimerase
MATLEQLKQRVWKANLELVERGLVIQTWGNASGVDRERGLMVIKPSGMTYARMKPRDMVVVSLAEGRVVAGDLKPSSDTATHLELYRGFAQIGGVVHTHSLYATAWAQARKDLPCYGTTQADYWRGELPCTRLLEPKEMEQAYEANTGRVILERFRGLDPLEQPGVLVASHGPFTWGQTVGDAVHNATVLEFVARLASETLRINPRIGPVETGLLDQHFLRKHGPAAYYGQAGAGQ